jgi:hypothetical protein
MWKANCIKMKKNKALAKFSLKLRNNSIEPIEIRPIQQMAGMERKPVKIFRVYGKNMEGFLGDGGSIRIGMPGTTPV